MLSKTLFCLVFALCLYQIRAAADPFNDWKVKYRKNFKTDVEETVRRSVFMGNLDMINNHNAKAVKTYFMGVNQFTAYTEEENQNMLCQVEQPDLSKFTTVINEDMPLLSQTTTTTTTTPTSLNWTALGAVTPVRNQGNCGSCWAFAGVAALEASYQLSKGTLMWFSDQYALDCTTNSLGCNGGRPQYVVSMVSQKGIVSILDYAAYSAVQNPCKTPNSTVPLYKMTSSTSPYTYYNNISAGSIKSLLVKKPLMVTVYASSYWFNYRSGILSTCGTFTSTNHAVLLTGYDINGNWMIKNSWGVGWGEYGYIRLGATVLCGMNTSTSIINPSFA